MKSRDRRERPSEWPDWFVPKWYPHFDQPLRDPERVRSIVESSEAVASHPFLPFIRFERTARKYKKEQQKDGTISGEFKRKPRDLKYASHVDSQIFRYYAQLLSERYEELISGDDIAASVLGYRRVSPPKCNIHFANDAFRWIELNAPCTVQTFDVRDFFESLDHGLLKRRWKSVLGVRELPEDHYAVFKAITQYSWVERDELFEAFGITKKKQKRWRRPICTPEQFRSVVRGNHSAVGLIQTKTGGMGIPQGSPISALLSNVYMLPVDIRMAAIARDRGGLYLRYSDDILLLCKPDDRDKLKIALEEVIGESKLELHDGLGKRTVCEAACDVKGVLTCQPPVQYLGFSFDGRTVRIRSQTIAKFLRRMRKAVRREKYLAEQRARKGGDNRLRRKGLYSRYTHFGARNFISGYSADARKVFEHSAIRAQVKRLWRELHAELVVVE